MKHLQDLFLPYELAELAKEKQFNEPCISFFFTDTRDLNLSSYDYTGETLDFSRNNEAGGYRYISAPLYQQIVDWFREKHGIVISCIYNKSSKEYYFYFDRINSSFSETSRLIGTYYEALNKAIEQAFRLI